MKKILIVAMLIAANVAIFARAGSSPASTQGTKPCYEGGVGASQCSISAGATLDIGVSAGCSVTCRDGYYACCGLDCTCIVERSKPDPNNPDPAI